ncbi:MAG: LPS assembly lipoprotein LptE [Nitrospiraceae bacterium]
MGLARAGALVLALILTAGCGYQFGVEGPGPTIGGSVAPQPVGPPKRVSLVNLLNNTPEPNLEVKFSNYLRREFGSASGAEVVNSNEAADYVVKGTIISLLVPTLSFSQFQTLESRVEAMVMVQAEDVRTKKIVWAQTSKGSSEFFVTNDLQFNRVLQTRALEQAGRFIANDLASRFSLYLEEVRAGKTPAVNLPAGQVVPMVPGVRR